jgi:hypothetical protein
VYVVLLVAAGAILVGVVAVAMGRGGEMAAFRRDMPTTFRPIRTPADVARLRLPIGPLGYQAHATADALTAIAGLLADRDYEIAALRAQIWRLETGREPDDNLEPSQIDSHGNVERQVPGEPDGAEQARQ